MSYRMQVLTAYLISPILAITGLRFSKDYRYGITQYHRIVYSIVSTVKANQLADKI